LRFAFRRQRAEACRCEGHEHATAAACLLAESANNRQAGGGRGSCSICRYDYLPGGEAPTGGMPSSHEHCARAVRGLAVLRAAREPCRCNPSAPAAVLEAGARRGLHTGAMLSRSPRARPACSDDPDLDRSGTGPCGARSDAVLPFRLSRALTIAARLRLVRRGWAGSPTQPSLIRVVLIVSV